MNQGVARPQISTIATRSNILKVCGTVSGCLAALVGLGWLGLRLHPAPFPSISQPPAPLGTIPLPMRLPEPVERFYREVYGERVPVLQSAVISGRGVMRPVFGISFPARFRFIHEAGHSYRHYFETTLFGWPLMRVNETFIGGIGRMELPWGIQEGQQIDQGANLSLWAEIASMLPAALLTDERVRWEPIDSTTALLVVPFGAGEERLLARFDPTNGRLWLLESMRYKDATGRKTLWLNHIQQWGLLGNTLLPTIISAIWGDDGKPWLIFTIEDVAYNVNIAPFLAAKGP